MLATPELILHTNQAQRLAEALPQWISQIPLYNLIKEQIGASCVMHHFHRLPQITKRDIRHNFPKNFLPGNLQLSELLDGELVELEHTSGTSEARTPLILPQGWWAEQESRALRLNSFVRDVLDNCPNPRRVTLSSPNCSGDICYTGVPGRSDRILGDTLYASLSRHPFLWSKNELDRMVEETAEWQPHFLDVDPVYGVVFARYCEQNGIRFPSLRFVLCSYEFVSLTHRRIIERAFGVPVFNLYGSTETGHLLMEDDSGRMRPSLETAFMEIVDADEMGVGHLVVTTLTNDYMPLIRYRIGDLVQHQSEGLCMNCRVHGRAADAFVTKSGRRVSVLQVDECFEAAQGVAHYQLLQQSESEYLLRYVPDHSSPAAPDFGDLRERLLNHLEADILAIQETDILMSEKSGKFRLGYPMVS